MAGSARPRPTARSVTRRQVLHGTAAAGLAVPLVAACGGEQVEEIPPEDIEVAEGAISTTEIPVGGGKIFAAEQVVVTQPTAGDFKAFSAVCTHQHCLVSEITDTIDCQCHFSKYSLIDGSVQSGPAPKPLPELDITVTGESITIG